MMRSARNQVQGAPTEREQLAAWMTERSFATGHGDTFADLLKELSWQVAELRGFGAASAAGAPTQAALTAEQVILALHKYNMWTTPFIAGKITDLLNAALPAAQPQETPPVQGGVSR